VTTSVSSRGSPREEKLDETSFVLICVKTAGVPINKSTRLSPKVGTAFAYRKRRRWSMLFTIAAVLLVLWVLGLVSGYAVGSFMYVLLVLAVVLFVVGLFTGRRPVV